MNIVSALRLAGTVYTAVCFSIGNDFIVRKAVEKVTGVNLDDSIDTNKIYKTMALTTALGVVKNVMCKSK